MELDGVTGECAICEENVKEKRREEEKKKINE